MLSINEIRNDIINHLKETDIFDYTINKHRIILLDLPFNKRINYRIYNKYKDIVQNMDPSWYTKLHDMLKPVYTRYAKNYWSFAGTEETMWETYKLYNNAEHDKSLRNNIKNRDYSYMYNNMCIDMQYYKCDNCRGYNHFLIKLLGADASYRLSSIIEIISDFTIRENTYRDLLTHDKFDYGNVMVTEIERICKLSDKKYMIETYERNFNKLVDNYDTSDGHNLRWVDNIHNDYVYLL